MTYPTHRESRLTGRVRVRNGAWRKLVLQVEIEISIWSACPPMPHMNPQQRAEWRETRRKEGRTELHWYDATWEDMQAVPRFELVPAGQIQPVQPWPRR